MAILRGSSFAFGALVMLFTLYNCSGQEEMVEDPLVTNVVTMCVTIGGDAVGCMSFGVFYTMAPITVLNFISLCVGNTTDPETGVARTYINADFHRTIRGFMIQGGDIQHLNGRGYKSIYGGSFDDEPIQYRLFHHGPGWIGMANAGNNTNGCQIYITCAQTSWLDKAHVLFGKVIAGMDVVRKIEYNPTGQYDRPIKPVVITSCTSDVLLQPYTVPKTPFDECNQSGSGSGKSENSQNSQNSVQ